MLLTQIMYNYHGEDLEDHSYSPTGEDVEIEQAVLPPPPTEPELDDSIVFDPKVSGIWDHLLAQMTDEQKRKLREQAKKEQVSPSYRHITPASSGKQEKTTGPGWTSPQSSGRKFLPEICVEKRSVLLMLDYSLLVFRIC